MDHSDLYLLRETYNQKHLLLCFNGPFSQALIEEIGNALKKHLRAEETPASSAMDVFAVYIELTQNIQQYAASQNYNDIEASATIVIGRNEAGHYEVSAGNVVETNDGEALCERIHALAAMDKAQLKAVYKDQLRRPREASHHDNAGLGLIDIARKASEPISGSVMPVNTGQKLFFSLRVVI
ncbi:MAG TPA: biofilm regulation protein kinase SiaB [Abditibacteriaceae bacterium]|jgi:hypothetical protein